MKSVRPTIENTQLTRHFLEQAQKRGVDLDDVRTALRRQTKVTAGKPGTWWIWGYDTNGRPLKVCVSQDDNGFVGITTARPD